MEYSIIKVISLFKTSLFYRLGLLVIVFTIVLTAVLYYQFEYFFTTQDSILDAHEHYYYSEMIESFGSPPDTNYIINKINNLKIWCGIYKKEINKGYTIPGRKYWSNLPSNIDINEFMGWVISTDYQEMYKINIPYRTQTGEINKMPATVVDNGEYFFYMVIDYLPPSDWYNLLIAILLGILFILGLYYFIRYYLKPVELMKFIV